MAAGAVAVAVAGDELFFGVLLLVLALMVLLVLRTTFEELVITTGTTALETMVELSLFFVVVVVNV